MLKLQDLREIVGDGETPIYCAFDLENEDYSVDSFVLQAFKVEEVVTGDGQRRIVIGCERRQKTA